MKPFGRSYFLDMYNCRAGAADDMELHYRFLEQLVDLIGMTKQGPPHVYHAPTSLGVELFPEKAGISAWIALIESGIQIHSIEPRRFISLDVYTCGEIDTITVKLFAQETFGYEMYEEHLLDRGKGYGE
jgi:S-adenosylmethionine/arginine decarboxylase-like enzyme